MNPKWIPYLFGPLLHPFLTLGLERRSQSATGLAPAVALCPKWSPKAPKRVPMVAQRSQKGAEMEPQSKPELTNRVETIKNNNKEAIQRNGKPTRGN